MIKNFDSRNYDFMRNRLNSASFKNVAKVAGGAEDLEASPLEISTDDDSAGLSMSALLKKASHTVNTVTGIGLTGGPRPEFTADPSIIETSSNIKTVHLQQFYLGIPVFQMNISVEFDARNKIRDIKGDNAEIPADIDLVPKMNALNAVTNAVQNILEILNTEDKATLTDPWSKHAPDEGVNGTIALIENDADFPDIEIAKYRAKTVSSFGSTPTRATVIGWIKNEDPEDTPASQYPLGAFVPANLVLFYQGPTVRLGWEIVVTLPDAMGRFRLIISADKSENSEVLYRQEVSGSLLAKARVYPFNPGETPARVEVSFPLDPVGYNVAADLAKNVLDAKFPRDWCDGDTCVGNNTKATKGLSAISLRATERNGLLFFEPSLPLGDEQKILNIFHFCNYMHDFYYLLGFDEGSGNFQQVDFTDGGSSGDPVFARAHPGLVRGTANMATNPDGEPPIMNMGEVVGTGRHTAFDADVVFHEFTHGVTNRLVGGRMNNTALEQPQSRGMGEGWSDYFALTIQNFHRPFEQERRVTGDWVSARRAGIRAFPYGPRKLPDSRGNFPDGFGDIIGGRYLIDEHNVGEVWCAALMHVNRLMGAEVGDYRRGHQIGWQIVVDGLKLSPSNPSFLNARDAILKALSDLHDRGAMNSSEYGKARRGAWKAFAEFGMGVSAFCPDSTLSGIVAAEDLPGDL